MSEGIEAYKLFRQLEERRKRANPYKFYDKDELIDEILKLEDKVEELMELYTTEREVKEDYKSIIKEVREYITSYESIETIQQFDHNKNNKDLDYSTIDEMTRRYMMVHDKILKILDKEKV